MPTEEDQIARLRRDIRNLVMARALMVNDFIKELAAIHDKEAVVKALKGVLYRQGQSRARAYLEETGNKALSPETAAIALQQLGPDGGRLFPIDCQSAGPDACDVQILSCPLKQAMQQAEANEQDFATLVDVLDASTAGFFEGLGFTVRTTLPGLDGDVCCRLRIARGAPE